MGNNDTYGSEFLNWIHIYVLSDSTKFITARMSIVMNIRWAMIGELLKVVKKIKCIFWDFIRLDQQRNFDIRGSIKVTNIVKKIQGYQQKWRSHMGSMERDHLPQLELHYWSKEWW